MAEYQVIARKWRPQRFADVVGQEHVVRTLKNAIRQNRTAHAYLFVGPRGVGKTTLARIFAKAMNCEHPRDGEPCCECRSCLAVAADNNLDVIEIDAASHNSAAEMRELAEEVLHAPVAGRYKIYIIDEVHMLTKQAWNALLKTVEEPPAHVKFIFATTEVHQVLPTIISRCQRFDLLPIPTRLIAGRLQLITDTENVKIEPAAINAIARAAEGGMRDAQSLLDQMIAFFATDDGQPITGEQVLALFGLTDRSDLDAILSALLENRPGDVVALIHRLARKGKNLETLFDDVLAALRGIRIALVLKNPGDILDEDPETVETYRNFAAATPGDIVPILLENLAPVGRVLHDALNKQVYLETILLKAMREAHAVRINDILARLNQLRTAGELQFLDRLPTEKPAALPASLLPVEKKTADSVVPASPTMPDPPPTPPSSSHTEPEEHVLTASPEAQETPDAPRKWFDRLAAAASGLSSATYFRMGTPESMRESILAVGFGLNVSAENYERLHAELPSYQKIFQELTGDWTSNVIFRRFAEPEPVPTDAPPAVEPLIPVSAPNPPADESVYAPEPVDPVDALSEETPIPDAVPEPEEMTAAPAVDVVAAEPPSETTAAVPSQLSGRRHSIINDDPLAIERAGKRPVIRDILDLFGGEVVDIHAKN